MRSRLCHRMSGSERDSPNCVLLCRARLQQQLLQTLPPGDREVMGSEITQLRAAVDASELAWKEDCEEACEEDEEEEEAAAEA